MTKEEKILAIKKLIEQKFTVEKSDVFIKLDDWRIIYSCWKFGSKAEIYVDGMPFATIHDCKGYRNKGVEIYSWNHGHYGKNHFVTHIGSKYGAFAEWAKYMARKDFINS